MNQTRFPTLLLILSSALALLTFSIVLAQEGAAGQGGAAGGDVGEAIDAPDPSTVTAAGILLTKTVGTIPGLCATTDTIVIPAGIDVTYCYRVMNTGDVTLDSHDLFDDQLGTILSDFSYSLAPGNSGFLTQTATINAMTVNTATWTALNSATKDQAAASDTATVNILQPAAFPVCTGFESGSLPGYFYPQTTSAGAANGRVAVTTAFPHSGNYALDLDTDCSVCGFDTTQSAVMVVDLAGRSNAYLDFWVHDHGDENHPQDGIFISDDGGATWAPIFSLNALPSSYQSVSIGLAAASSGAGMSLVDGFQIKFQSLGNFSIPSDGYSFDDICVEPPEITLVKSVGINRSACASTDSIEISTPTEVTYCYRIANTGNVTLGLHDLSDDRLGMILSGFAYSLAPGDSGYLTQTVTISATTVNTAVWTAHNPGPAGTVTSIDSATVTFLYRLYLPVIIKP
jgi:hypothetical protein